ncbi:MAG: lysine exporter LysO family protein [Deltaproteobacteria bacterium]|nr:lysine exporter LysO family protein [Deltaproteobacteria bacterium]
MLWMIFLSVAAGLIAGFMDWIPRGILPHLDRFITFGVCLLVFSVGVTIGQSRDIWRQMKALGARALLLPAGVAAGTLLGSLAAPVFIPIGFREALAVGAGFGWYSLSGVLLMQLHSAELGALAFLTNVFRELLSIVLIPFLARFTGPYTMIAPGGATTMDTTLPLIHRFSDADGTLLAFINGFLLSLLVPFLVPLFIG